MTNKYPLPCERCGETVPAGSGRVWKRGRRWIGRHFTCAPGRARQTRADREYEAGYAEGARYCAEKRIYGEALAEQFALADEMARWNRGDDY